MGSSTQFDWSDLIGSGSYKRPNLWGDLLLGGAVAEVCDDNVDNDCDGNIDGSDSDCAALCDGVTACVDDDKCCPSGCDSALDTDCSPVSCAAVTACTDDDGCCPKDCVGSDTDCSVTGTVACTDDGEGGKTCRITEVTGCNASGSAPWMVLLCGVLVFGSLVGGSAEAQEPAMRCKLIRSPIRCSGSFAPLQSLHGSSG